MDATKNLYLLSSRRFRRGGQNWVEFGHDGVFLDTEKLTLERRFECELLRTLNESDVFLAEKIPLFRGCRKIQYQRRCVGETRRVSEATLGYRLNNCVVADCILASLTRRVSPLHMRLIDFYETLILGAKRYRPLHPRTTPSP